MIPGGVPATGSLNCTVCTAVYWTYNCGCTGTYCVTGYSKGTGCTDRLFERYWNVLECTGHDTRLRRSSNVHRGPKAESDRQSRLNGVRSRGILASLGHNMCRVTRKVLTRHEVTRLLTRRVEKHAMSRRLNEYRSERIGARACADRGQRSVGLVVGSRTYTPLYSGERVPRHSGQSGSSHAGHACKVLA